MRVFSAKIDFWLEEKLLRQIIFRRQHSHISFLHKDWYIMEIHHKKWKTSMWTLWLLTLAMPEKTKILKIDPTLTLIISRSQPVHKNLFGFSDSLSPKLCKEIIKSTWKGWLLLILSCKIIILTYVWSPKSAIMGEAIQVCKMFLFQMRLKCL